MMRALLALALLLGATMGVLLVLALYGPTPL